MVTSRSNYIAAGTFRPAHGGRPRCVPPLAPQVARWEEAVKIQRSTRGAICNIGLAEWRLVGTGTARRAPKLWYRRLLWLRLLEATVDHEPRRPLISCSVARQRPRMFDKELLAMLREQYVSCDDRPRSPARRRPRGTGAAAPRPLEPGGRSHDRWRRGGKLQRRRRRGRLCARRGR